MITAVTTCMGRRNHLEMTLPLMLEEFDHVIVVDWSCPEDSGAWAEREGAQVVHRKGEKYFHGPKARNLGASAVQSRSVCFVDADCLVMTGLKNELESIIDLSHMAIASRTAANIDIPNLCGFMGLDIGQFWGVGGYPVELEGYGLDDIHLRARLRLERGLEPKRVSPGALGSIRHTNELRGRYFEESINVSGPRNHKLLMEYLKSHGVTDWINDPRTSEIAYRL